MTRRLIRKMLGLALVAALPDVLGGWGPPRPVLFGRGPAGRSRGAPGTERAGRCRDVRPYTLSIRASRPAVVGTGLCVSLGDSPHRTATARARSLDPSTLP